MCCTQVCFGLNQTKSWKLAIDKKIVFTTASIHGLVKCRLEPTQVEQLRGGSFKIGYWTYTLTLNTKTVRIAQSGESESEQERT